MRTFANAPLLLLMRLASTHAMRLPPTPLDARRLILVRHGSVDRSAHEPPIPDGALYGGNLEVPLSETGQQEAIAAAKVIADFAADEGADAVQFVASSPMQRAIFGAEKIAAAVQKHHIGQVRVETYELFREIDRGPIGTGWTMLTREQIAEKWGDDAFDKSCNDPEYGRTFGGEGMGDLRERVLTARDFVLKKVRPGGAAVIVSHMWVTRAMVADALGEDDIQKVDIPTASISVIDYPPDAWPPAIASEPASVPLIGYKPNLGGDAAAEAAAREEQKNQ